MSEYSVQQQKIISQYRQTNNLGYVISDDEVVSIMQKEMQQTGKVYPGFEHLASTSASSKAETNQSNPPSPMAPADNVFGTGFYQGDNKGITIERTNKNYVTVQPTLIQLFAMNFLKNIMLEGNAIVSERDKEAGVMSRFVNLWQENFNEEYSQSHVKKSLSKTQHDLQVMEKAAKGEPIGYNFLGEPIYQTFEEVFKSKRGVEFNPENIADCAEKSQTYAKVKTTVEMVNKTKAILATTTKGDVKSQMSPEESSKAIIQAFKLAGVTSTKEINKTLADINEKYKGHPDVLKYGGNFRINKNKQGEYVIYRTDKNGYPAEATNEELRLIANEMSQRLDRTLADAIGVEYSNSATPEEVVSLTEKKLKEYQDIYEKSFKKAYGSKDLKILSEEYVAKQQQGVANIEVGINILSTALMILPPVAVAARGTALGAKLGLASKASLGGKIVQGLETAQKVSAPLVMAAMTLRPTELLEQILSQNGMSAEEWKAWGIGVLQNSVYMTTGMKVSQLAEQGAAIYKTKALVNTLKKAGKSTDEIIAMVKANPVKFPDDIVKSFKSIDKLAKALQVTSEVALDISSTYFLNMAMSNGDIQMQDWISSIAFAISGGVLQKQFAHLTTEAKVQYLCDAFKDYGVTAKDAKNILQTMDDISEGKIKSQSKSQKTNSAEDSSATTTQETNATTTTQADSKNSATPDDVVITDSRPSTPAQDAETSINKRLESANSREEFASLRDEIKNMPEGEDKKALQEEYLKKYNEWSQNPQRPDIKMEYIPEKNNTETSQTTNSQRQKAEPSSTKAQNEASNTRANAEEAKPSENIPAKEAETEECISDFDAVMKFLDFSNEIDKDYEIEGIINACTLAPDKVSTRLIDEAIRLVKSSNKDFNEIAGIISNFKNKNKEIDTAKIEKFHELVNNGQTPNDAISVIIKSEDKKGNYREDYNKKLLTLKKQDNYSGTLLKTCEINGTISNEVWEKVLDLDALGYDNRTKSKIIETCLNKETIDANGFTKTTGFNNEIFSKIKELITKEKISANNAVEIMDACKKGNEISAEYYARALYLKDKINENAIKDFVTYDDKATSFMLEIKDKYKIEEHDLKYIIKSCHETTDGKNIFSDTLSSKVEELLTKHKIPASEISTILDSSKVDGKADEKLYTEILKMHEAGIYDIKAIVTASKIKDTAKNKTEINYDFIDKAIEWTQHGISENWIQNYIYAIRDKEIDITKEDYVLDLSKAGFPSKSIDVILSANLKKDTDFQTFTDKIIEMNELGIEKNAIIKIIESLQGNIANKENSYLSTENLEIAIEMYKSGIKHPENIILKTYNNKTAKESALQDAYQKIQEGISEDRVEILQNAINYHQKNEKIEKLSAEVAKALPAESKALNTIIDKMYEHEKLAPQIAEAIKAGADENHVIAVIDMFQSTPQNIEIQYAISTMQSKCLKAMQKKPEKAEAFTNILRYIEPVIGIRVQILDTCLAHPDNWMEIADATKVLISKNKELYTDSSKACNLISEFTKAEIPLEDNLRMVNLICEASQNPNTIYPPEFTQKIIDLYNSGKIDDATLNLINHLPKTNAKGVEILDTIVKLKEQKHLTDDNLNDQTLSKIIYNEKTNEYYDNYAEILDFYVENSEIINKQNTDSKGTKTLYNLIENYSSQIEGNSLDLQGLKAITKLAKETSINLNIIDGVISNGYAGKLAEFLDKFDLKTYETEVSQILKLLENPFTHKYNSDILSPQLTKEKLNFILDLQKQLNEKDIKDKLILNNNFVKEVINEGKDVPEEAFNKLRFYIEAELSTIEKGEYLNPGAYLHIFETYKNSPDQIDKIESIIFDHEWHDWISPIEIMKKFSTDKEILPKQLELMNKLFEISGNSKDLSIQNLIISTLKPESPENIDAKLTFIAQNESKMKISNFQKIFNEDKTDYKILQLLSIIRNVRKDNIDIANTFINKTLTNKKFNGILLEYINDNNKKFINKILEENKIENSVTLSSLAQSTGASKEICEFMEKNIDIFPKDILGIISENLNEYNKEFAIELFTKEYANISEAEKVNILRLTNNKNLNLITQLCDDKDTIYKGEQIQKVAYLTTSYPETYKLAEALYTDKSAKCPPEQIGDIIEAAKLLNNDIKTIHLSKKIKIFETLNSTPKTVLELCKKVSGIDLENKLIQLTTILGKKKDTVKISKEQQKQFVTNILTNNNPISENVLRNYDFKQYGKEGLPLKYTRAEFTKNIETIIKNLSEKEQSIILEHFGLERGIAGFDGLPNNKPFEMQGASEELINTAAKVQSEIENFTTKNSINTGDPEVDTILNGLISGLPEFTSIVGKEQHGTHAYSVDIHTLKVLQSAMNNPLYEKLSDKDKTILKFAALCHDLGKKGGTVDKGHASASAEYVIGILDKFNFPRSISDRIIDIVDNHHWFEAYNTGAASAEDVAVRCRRPEDFLIYEILAKADFENVNDNFHLLHSQGVETQKEFDDYMAQKMEAIGLVLDNIYSKANLVFDTKFMHNGAKFPTESAKIGKETVNLKVLDLNKLKDNASLEEYGFAKGTTKKNARFLIHMTAPENSFMESVYILTSNSLNQSAWSTSLIKADNNKTYGDRKFGFIFDIDLANISEAHYLNTSSGGNKDINVFKDILITKDNDVRTYVKDNLIKDLSSKGIKLNDKEYAILAKYLMSKKYTTQITKDVKIGDKVINAKDLVECLEKSRDKLFKGFEHSEIVPINPRIQGLIAKVNSIEECPEEFLRFAKEHNLPIVLMKAAQKE